MSSWKLELKDFVNPPLSSVFFCILSLHMPRVEGNVTEVFLQLVDTGECFHGSHRTPTNYSQDGHIAANSRQDSRLYC